MRWAVHQQGAYPADLEPVGGAPDMPLTATPASYRRLSSGGAVVASPEVEAAVEDVLEAKPVQAVWTLPPLARVSTQP